MTTSATTIPNDNTTSMMVTEEERLDYLAELQRETTVTMIPAISFLLLLAVTGLVGNCLVLFVYSNKFSRTSTRIFIMTIAAFDLVANVVAIPGEIYDMFHIWDFSNRSLCQGRLFFSALTTLSSAMILLAVAVVRYRKVCVPYGWQVTVKQARYISLVIAGLGVIFSLPYVIINGVQTKDTPRDDIQGHECTTDDEYKDTIWPLLNTGFFLLLFFLCCIPLTVLYILIGIKAWRHSKLHGVSNSSPTSPAGTRSTYINSDSGTTEQQEDRSKSDNKLSIKLSTKSSLKSSKKSAKSKKLGKSLSSDSLACSSVGFGSLADIMEEFRCDKDGGDGLGKEQYIVRILQDSVEIRTPMMGEFIVHLKEASGEGENFLDKLVSANDDELCVQQVTSFSDEHGKQVLCNSNSNNLTVERDGGYENIAFSDSGEAETKKDNKESTRTQKEQEQNTHNDVQSIEGYNVSENDNCENEQNQITSDLKSGIPRCKNEYENDLNEKSSSETQEHQKTDDKLVKHISKTTNKDHENFETRSDSSKEETKNKNEICFINQLDRKDSSDVTMRESSSDVDPMAALRWVDIIFCPEELKDGIGDQDAKNSLNSSKDGTPFSFRMSPTNQVLKKAEWLRSIIVEALAKAKTKSKTSDIIAEETEKSSNIELQTGNVITTNCENLDDEITPCPEQTVSSVRDSRDDSTASSPAQKLKRFVSKAKSLKKLRYRSRSSSRRSSARRRPLGRTTAMLIIISAIYTVGFLPHLALMFFKFTSPDEFASLTMVELSFYNLFLRSYFLNCAANPVIYSLCDKNFRRECFSLFPCFSRR